VPCQLSFVVSSLVLDPFCKSSTDALLSCNLQMTNATLTTQRACAALQPGVVFKPLLKQRALAHAVAPRPEPGAATIVRPLLLPTCAGHRPLHRRRPCRPPGGVDCSWGAQLLGE
jgi:hypothetical protein